MTRPLFVIPDVHGHADKLNVALARVARAGGPEASIVFLGDYVDRGPDSRAVLQTLVDGLEQGRDWTVLRGNHDQMMLDALGAQSRLDMRWMSYESGSAETLASYGMAPHDPVGRIRAAVPDSHIALLNASRHYHETADLILVHAGIQPGVPMPLQPARDLMWIREPFLSDGSDHGKLVVHGHSPVDWPEHHGNRVALDGGAGWGRTLHVAMFEGRDCWLLREDGPRVPLRPA